ncbi:hypothetical protein AVEN_60209-1 [Araneus ventricosus]|uniref:Uncharacterized protein n=1 Tax=Araneus ventricosus TaxID=182803 RepID=A0A4Y2CMT2_ARAVE|nr:hypothetical protein AVEN_60209-1 [Araneus ventricosus]
MGTVIQSYARFGSNFGKFEEKAGKKSFPSWESIIKSIAGVFPFKFASCVELTSDVEVLPLKSFVFANKSHNKSHLCGGENTSKNLFPPDRITKWDPSSRRVHPLKTIRVTPKIKPSSKLSIAAIFFLLK